VLWRYRGDRPRKATYSHGSTTLELAWTLIPGIILVFLAFYQFGAWRKIKFGDARPDRAPVAEVTGKQFYWAVRYPGEDGRLGTGDDLHVVNDLHVVKGEPTTVTLRSTDVIHSFFLPSMRIKQDAVPGLAIPVWFDVDEAGTYELVCAELCGWGHTRMRGVVTVHETRADFDEWFRGALAEQRRSQLAAPAGGATDAEAGQ
jgi:cytochrome c oxidase subunit 2